MYTLTGFAHCWAKTLNPLSGYPRTQKASLEDTKFPQGLGKSCKTMATEWEERSSARSEELMALTERKKTLDDDDALELTSY